MAISTAIRFPRAKVSVTTIVRALLLVASLAGCIFLAAQIHQYTREIDQRAISGAVWG